MDSVWQQPNRDAMNMHANQLCHVAVLLSQDHSTRPQHHYTVHAHLEDCSALVWNHFANLAGSGKVQCLMNGKIGNVLIVLVYKPSRALDDEFRLVLAVVLDVSSDMAETCVLEVTSQELKKNGFASTWRSHQQCCPALHHVCRVGQSLMSMTASLNADEPHHALMCIISILCVTVEGQLITSYLVRCAACMGLALQKYVTVMPLLSAGYILRLILCRHASTKHQAS